MRKYVMTSVVLLPLLLTFSQAAQNWSVDPPEQPWVFSSEDSGTSSYLGVDISDVTSERLSALKPVSYTHLDVYKRQALPRIEAENRG